MKRLKGKVALTLVVTMMGTTVSPNTIGVVQAADNGGKEMRIETASNAWRKDYEYSVSADDLQPNQEKNEESDSLSIASYSNAEYLMSINNLEATINEKGQRVVYASNTDELINAIGSNTEIILEGKTYDINRDENNVSLGQLYIGPVENLTIKGQNGTRIVSDSGSDVVLDIWGCKNLVIENAVIGHDLPKKPQYECDLEIGVINGWYSEITLNNCDIFGCGWMGIEAAGCDLTVNNSKIRDCSSYIADITNSQETWNADGTIEEIPLTSEIVKDPKCEFNNCQFYGNGYALPFVVALKYVGDEKKIIFNSCVIRDNYNPNFCGDLDHSKAYWEWDEEKGKYIYKDIDGNDTLNPAVVSRTPVLHNCTIVNNAWQEKQEENCDVTLVVNQEIYRTISIKKGDRMEEPILPDSLIPNGYKFKEWQCEGKKIDFSQPVMSDIRLDAVLEKITYETKSWTQGRDDSDYEEDSNEGNWILSGDKYQCWLNGKQCKNGAYTITWKGKKNKYYFDKNGYMMTGWINGHFYSPEAGDGYGADITSASLALGSFGYAGNFVNDIRKHSGYLYSLKKWKEGLSSVGVGTYQYLKDLINGNKNAQWAQSVSDAYMTNPEYTENMIASIVNEKFKTSTIYTGDVKKKAEAYADATAFINGLIDSCFGDENKDAAASAAEAIDGLVESAAADNGIDTAGWHDIFSDSAKGSSMVKLALKDADFLQKCAMDYTENILYLNDLKASLGENSTLGKAVEKVKKDYETNFSSKVANLVVSNVNTIAKVMGKENKFADVTTQKGRWDAAKELIDSALNTKVKSVDLGIKLVTDQMPSLNAVDNVVYSSYMRTDAIYALKKAEADLVGNSKDKQKIAEYQAAFDMAKEITKKQYESMLTYYQSQAYGAKDKNDKIQFVQDEMKKLNDITYGNYYCNGR